MTFQIVFHAVRKMVIAALEFSLDECCDIVSGDVRADILWDLEPKNPKLPMSEE
jgi:hypothetical protein